MVANLSLARAAQDFLDTSFSQPNDAKPTAIEAFHLSPELDAKPTRDAILLCLP
jgi:hypothetical protein